METYIFQCFIWIFLSVMFCILRTKFYMLVATLWVLVNLYKIGRFIPNKCFTLQEITWNEFFPSQSFSAITLVTIWSCLMQDLVGKRMARYALLSWHSRLSEQLSRHIWHASWHDWYFSFITPEPNYSQNNQPSNTTSYQKERVLPTDNWHLFLETAR